MKKKKVAARASSKKKSGRSVAAKGTNGKGSGVNDAALKPGGKAITLEFVPNDDRVTPPTAAAFSLIMLANTDAGDAYTFSEYEKMFRNAGFAKSTLHPVPEMPQQVIVSEKSA